MHTSGKVFVKTYIKAIRDTFFSQYVEFPNKSYFYPTEGGSLNFQTCRESSPFPVPSLVGYPDLHPFESKNHLRT